VDVVSIWMVTCCWIFQETQKDEEEEEEESEKSGGHMVKSVLQAKLQKLAIYIGYFGTSQSQTRRAL